MHDENESPIVSLAIPPRAEIRAAMLRQNAWIDKRLSELGMSLGGKKWDRKWVTDEYVTGIRQGNQAGR